MAIPGHNHHSIRGVGATRYRVPDKRSKEGDEGVACATRSWEGWPNIMVEVRYSESITQLRFDARQNSGGRTKW